MSHPKPSNTCHVIRMIIALVATFSLLPASVFADSFNVENIRVAKNGQVTRVVFDTSATPTYKVFTLNNPRRVVIDLTDAKLLTKVDQSVFKASFVDKLRHASRSSKKLRIVLDLNQQIVPKSFVLAPNGGSRHRLVIDLKNSQATNTRLAKASISKTATAAKAKPTQKQAAKSVSKSVEKIAKTKPVSKAKPEQDIIAKVTSSAAKPAKAKQIKKVAPAAKKSKTVSKPKTLSNCGRSWTWWQRPGGNRLRWNS